MKIIDSDLLRALIASIQDKYVTDEEAVDAAYQALLDGDTEGITDRLAVLVVEETAAHVAEINSPMSLAESSRELGAHFVCMAEELRALGKALRKG